MSKSAKVLFAVVGGVVLLLLSALPGVMMRDMGMIGGMGSMMSGDMIGILFMLLFWGLVVALLVLVEGDSAALEDIMQG